MLKTDIDNAVEIVTLIRDLTLDEGDEIRIHNDNPDFGGPNPSISVVRRFCEPVHIFGGSVLDCLRTAKRKRDMEDRMVKHV